MVKIMKKVYDFLFSINVWLLVLGAILTVLNCPVGSFVFLETCVIGFIDSCKNSSFNGKIINGTLGAMNLYYSAVTIVSLLA